MRIRFSIVCVGLYLAMWVGMMESLAKPSEDYDVPLVTRALREQQQGVSFSFTEKYVNRLGDRVSIALLKILEDRDLKDPRTLRAALRLVRQSFMYPNLISIIQDKKPKVTLFLLDYLNIKISDPSLKGEISALTKFVKEKTGPEPRN